MGYIADRLTRARQRRSNGLAMVTLNGDLNWRRSEAADIYW
jgi:hypothetical protein